MYDRKQLKRTAKEAVRTTRPKVWVVTLVYMLLTTVVVWVANGLTPNPFLRLANAVNAAPDYFAAYPEMMWGMLSGGAVAVCIFVSVLTSLYQVVMEYGYAGYCLKVWRRQDTAYGDVFGAFPVAGKAIGSAIMVGIYTFLWSLLAALGYVALAVLAGMLMTYVAEFLGALVLAAAVVLLVIAILCISYRYCLTPYFLMSDPEMGVFQAITASKVAMRGNIRKRLALDLSFLGWGLLVALIIYVVVFAGMFIAEFVLYAGMELNPMMAMGTGSLFGIVVFLLAFLISLPLTLWLTGYEGVAQAGFFDVLTGGHALEDCPPIPPQPPQLTRDDLMAQLRPAEPPIPPAPPVAEEVPVAEEAPAEETPVEESQTEETVPEETQPEESEESGQE